MRLLDRFLGMELVWPFIFGVAAFSSTMFATQNLLHLTSQVINGLPVLVALQLVLLSMPQVIVYTLPMAAVLAVLVGFSRLSGDSEITALYASGVSLYRTMVPVIALGIVVTALSFALSEVIVPYSNSLQAEMLKKEPPASMSRIWADKDSNSTVYAAGGFDLRKKALYDVTITRYKDNKPEIIFQAREAIWKGLGKNDMNTWKLHDGWMYALKDQSTVSVRFQGLQTEPVEIRQSPESIELTLRKPDQMTYSELGERYTILVREGAKAEELRKLKVHRYNRLSIPLAAFVFALIGAPLAIRPVRASRSAGIAFSILIIFGYWFTWHFTTAVAVQGGMSPLIGAFTADILGLALGLILLVRTPK